MAHPAVGAHLAAAPDVLAAQAPDAQGNLENREVTQLRKHYLEKQKEAEGPWSSLLTGASLVLAVVTAIFANVSAFPTLLIGLGVFGMLSAFRACLVSKFIDGTYRDAADALASPGFYEWARENPRQLATAQAIIAAHQQFIQPPAAAVPPAN